MKMVIRMWNCDVFCLFVCFFLPFFVVFPRLDLKGLHVPILPLAPYKHHRNPQHIHSVPSFWLNMRLFTSRQNLFQLWIFSMDFFRSFQNVRKKKFTQFVRSKWFSLMTMVLLEMSFRYLAPWVISTKINNHKLNSTYTFMCSMIIPFGSLNHWIFVTVCLHRNMMQFATNIH